MDGTRRAAGTDVGRRERAPARAVVWGQLALGFQRPSGAARARVYGPEGRGVLVDAALLLDGAAEAGRLAGAARRFARLPAPTLEELQLRYDRLFGHTARGPVCAYETEYGAGGLFRQPQELAHISGYYGAFGLRPRREGERADHIACECEFMGFLARKEVWASGGTGGGVGVDDECAEQLETTREAQRSFLRAHLGRFGTAFGTRLRRADPEGVFGGLSDMLVELLRHEAAALGVPLGPATLDLRPPEVDTTPMACGGCEALGPSPTPGAPEGRP